MIPACSGEYDSNDFNDRYLTSFDEGDSLVSKSLRITKNGSLVSERAVLI